MTNPERFAPLVEGADRGGGLREVLTAREHRTEWVSAEGRRSSSTAQPSGHELLPLLELAAYGTYEWGPWPLRR